MKKLFLCSLLFVLVFTSCATVGSFEILDNNILVSYNCKNIPKCCEQYNFFTNVSFSSYFYSPNFLIGRSVKDNLVKSVRLEKLPNYLKAKGPILEYLPKEAIINYYIIDKAAIFLYSFTLDIDKDKLDSVSAATIDYSKAMNNAIYWKDRADIAAQPMIEKSRNVPYTAYRSVSKPVTRFRYNYFTEQNEAYTDYEYYQEPYIAYRTEKYMAPNPDYNPTLAAQYTENYTYWQEKIFRAKEATQIDWYKLYFN